MPNVKFLSLLNHLACRWTKLWTKQQVCDAQKRNVRPTITILSHSITALGLYCLVIEENECNTLSLIKWQIAIIRHKMQSCYLTATKQTVLLEYDQG